MNVTIVEQGPGALAEYATVPIAYRVESRLRVDLVQAGLGGLQLIEEPVTPAYVKDYDAIEGKGPNQWGRQWDLSNWGTLSGFDNARRIGGAVIAWNTPGLHMLGGQRDVAALWDIRVAAEYRRAGIGAQLFSRAANWARERGCRALSVETQNINVPACRFYVRCGCRLGAVNRRAYPDLPEETQLIWWLDL